MRLFNTVGCCCVLPIIILLAGIVHISPDASLEFDRLCNDGRNDVQQLGQYMRGKCRLGN